MFWRFCQFVVWELAPCCGKHSHVDLRCVGNAGIVEKRGESSAGKVRGGWILFTWGRSLFLIPFKRAVCLGQYSIDFWSGGGGWEVITGCTWKLESSHHFMDKKTGQWKSSGLCCSKYPPFEICLLLHLWLWTPSSEVYVCLLSCAVFLWALRLKTFCGSGLPSLRSLWGQEMGYCALWETSNWVSPNSRYWL